MMTTNNLPIAGDTRRFYLVGGGLIVTAWLLLAVWQGSAHAGLLSHETLGHHGPPLAARVAAFIPGWLLMTVAMMLPGSLPQLNSHARPDRRGMAGLLLVTGYLLPWLLFGGLAYVGDYYLHQLVDHAGPLAAYEGWIAPSVVLLAGLYQFSPAKHRCLAACRMSNEQPGIGDAGHAGGAAVLRHGVDLGLICVGSGWALMLLMFALGHNRLDWMLVLGAIMAAERLAPWGDRLARLAGAILVVWAVLWVLAL